MKHDDPTELQKAVETRLTAVPGIIDYFHSKASEAKESLMEATLSGNNIQAIQYASLAEYFQDQAVHLEELSKSQR